MKKRSRKIRVLPIFVPALVLALAAVIGLFFVNTTVFYVALSLFVLLSVYTLWYVLHLAKTTRRYLENVASVLGASQKETLESSPFPVALCSSDGHIFWHNRRFFETVAEQKEWIGADISEATGGISVNEFSHKEKFEIAVGERQFSLLVQRLAVPADAFVLYYDENTRLKKLEREYEQSRPAVLMIYIDNLDELMRKERESDRMRAAGRVEAVLEDWYAAGHIGIFRKYEQGRFLLITEHRYLEKMAAGKFNVLDKVRQLDIEGRTGFTLSIGAGEGEHLAEAEEAAKQALEMALGRGGDQAAVKHKNGFDFYGGVSKGVEKRTKVRSRIVASALLKLMDQSDCVITMGHRFSDVDSLGSALALTSLARSLGREAFTVVDQNTSLAQELIDRYKEAGKEEWMRSPEQALARITEKTLLIITDTHSPAMLESKAVYEKAAQVVVVDHHRKMVDHIENAVIFFHETYSSSASEMVTELIQTMEHGRISQLEAEGLLAGIMLDTRNFVMRVGSRTFEAAAALRNMGADTVSVKRLFSGSMETYHTKAAIMAAASPYRNTVITGYDKGGSEVRIAAAQAADELLAIKEVDAAFALFTQDGGVNISARSLGDFNVQLAMEALGGGGHITMAGAYLPETTLDTAIEKLKQVIDTQLEAVVKLSE